MCSRKRVEHVKMELPGRKVDDVRLGIPRHPEAAKCSGRIRA
jgi:hypothetical protein